tara:strand:- start:209 stop:790 length:582 start_codon:yes stop_codon:yes gene_type:complete
LGKRIKSIFYFNWINGQSSLSFLRVASVALWIVTIACSVPENSESEDVSGPAVEGRLAPQFSVKDRSGQLHSLNDFRGKVVLVNFWATWCPPCIEEMPSMDSLQKTLDQEKFSIIAISVDDSWDSVDTFIKSSDLDLNIYSDFEGKVAKLYGTHKVPETYILNKEGIVVRKILGEIDWTSPKVLSYLKELGAV